MSLSWELLPLVVIALWLAVAGLAAWLVLSAGDDEEALKALAREALDFTDRD